ncbi:hypothetical protein CVT24_004183 [Panaeolus cyanescens]|uniref:Uncharacterized protein n=1 Tax=Panaeolus cyanescens TaxID=181874 RepID=A0A409YX68_9AGAR|nr:hypothetical protein CVT24_004183 [Panaeolus cyanescens]
MWDQVCNKRLQKRAEDNFAYIREILFKDMIEGGTGLTTFTNTQESTVAILDTCVKHSNKTKYCAMGTVHLGRSQLCITPYGRQLYSDLLARIEEAWVRKSSLKFDLAQTDSAQDPELNALLQNRLQETIRILDRFALQLAEFGSAPDGMPALPEKLAAYFIHKYGQRQQYAAVLGPLEDQWKEKLTWEEVLTRTWIDNDPAYKADAKDALHRAIRQLPNLAKQLVEFGPPPDGVSGPQGNLAAYVESQPWLQSSQDTVSKSESVIVPQPTSLEPDAFAEDGDPRVSAVDVTSELDDKLHLHNLPEKSGAPQPLHPDTGSAADNQSESVNIATASTTMLLTPELRVDPPREPTHQSTSAAFTEDGGARVSAVERDFVLELDDKPQPRELPARPVTPQPTASTTRPHAHQVDPLSEPTHQSSMVRPPGASGAKPSRLRRFLARLFFWKKRSPGG